MHHCMTILCAFFALGCSIASAYPSKAMMYYEDEASAALTCDDQDCLFLPCSISSCPKYPNAVCINDCATCSAHHYLITFSGGLPHFKEVTSTCDPCAAVKCSAGRQCYLDSAFAPYCANSCSATFTCPTGYHCQKYPNVCEEGLEMTGCGYYGYCLKN